MTSDTVEIPPQTVQNPPPNRDSIQVAHDAIQTSHDITQTPPPSYSEVQQKHQQGPSVSYQQNAYPQIPANIGQFPHQNAPNYQPVYFYESNIQSPLYNVPQYAPPHDMSQLYQQQSMFRPQHPPPLNVQYQFPGPNPNLMRPQRFPNNQRPPPQFMNNNQNVIRQPQNKIVNKPKENQKKPIGVKVEKPAAVQKSNNEIILNLDEVSKYQNSSKNPNFIEFSNHLNKTKFKPLGEARKSLVNNKYLSDVKFVINNEIIYGHKLFLATSSAKFHKHFHVDGNVEMKIEEIDKNIFIEVISYCYTGQLKISEENVLSFLLAANLLEVRQITNMCSGFINSKINPETIFVVFEKAIEHKVEEFQKKCLDFITKNEDKCFQSKGFYDISLPSLMMILNALKFQTEKSNKLIEKWTNGFIKTEDTPATPSKPTGAVRKPKNQKKIPSLLDLPPPPAEFAKFYETQKPIRPFAAASVENLINFDDDDDASGIICKDDSDDDLSSEISFGGHPERSTTLVVSGKSESIKTEFSRIDFQSMKSINVHEIWFNANLFANDESKSIRLTVMLVDEGKKTHVHTRFIKRDLKPGELEREKLLK